MPQLEEQHEGDDETTSTTVQDLKVKRSNKYELFEKFISFIDTEEELNPTLAGYFCKLFQVLISNKSKEVLEYVIMHPEIADHLVRHIYSKSICEILIKILNLFDTNNSQKLGNVENLRQNFLFKIAEKLDPQYGMEAHLNT